MSDEEQFKKYITSAEYLAANGYTRFFIFDNYGNYLCETDPDGLMDMDRYLARLMRGKSNSTFPYTDVLACKPDKASACREAVRRYADDYS